MRNKVWVKVALLVMVSGLLMFSGCAKQAVKSDADLSQAAQDAAALEAEKARRAAEIEAARLAAERDAQRQAEEVRLHEARNQFLNEHIYFEFDSASLTSSAMAVLKDKAAWLQDQSAANVLIEGHCDERGTTEYNLALGERRAQSAKAFLLNMGIAPSRLSTVSYGEERPLDPSHNEAAWAKNRRAQFVIE
ncbi:MAG: peptidoglycan-associated lipoprotein Pal [Desulfobacteraceae bacterium]|jgi:peptidoglycan-associated lipoprotein|nr:peptidoglycan-associated lipoprotein Pal [Desulfobacteraceae bacterium]